MSRTDDRWADNRQTLEEAARNAGVDVGVMVRIAGFESKFNPEARPIAVSDPSQNQVRQYDGTMAISSAHGYGQFINDTWHTMINRYGEKYGVENAAQLTLAQANTPALREDARLQAAMLAEFTRENIAQAARYGGQDVDANVYAMHNLGGGDGPRFLQALRDNPDARVDSVLSAKVISGNASLYGNGGISLQDAYARMGQQMDRYDAYAQQALRGLPSGSISANGSARTNHDPAADGVLTLNEHGDAVKQLQQQLIARGYTDANGQPLVADGAYGPNTKHAVERFQHDRGLTVDGIAGRDTLQALNDEQAKQSSSGPTPRNLDPQVLLREDSRGADVRALQEALIRLDYTDRAGHALSADGIFGPRTEEAVKAFQHDKGLQVDGVVGPLSLAALNQARGQDRAPSSLAARTQAGSNDFFGSLFDAARSGNADGFRNALASLADTPIGRAFNDMRENVQRQLGAQEAEQAQKQGQTPDRQ